MKLLLKQGVTGFRIGPGAGRKDWLATPGMQQMWKTSAESRQPMCCLINPENLADVSVMCGRFPETPVVIDHFARIGITGEIVETDLKNLCGLSRHPQVRVKISAYYALGKKQPPHDELIPMIRRLYEAYGPGRLMWASDCPYQLGDSNTYRSSISLVRDRIDFVTADERRQLLRTTAEQTFFFV
jgi:predicted TIM-barrel fold metal-dependent hydrolase